MSDDISQTPPARAVAWRRDQRQPGGGTRHQDERAFAHAADAYGRWADGGLDVADSVWVQGIPAEDLTPPVRRAIGALMAEVGHLRQQLDARATGPGPAPHSFIPTPPEASTADSLRQGLEERWRGHPAEDDHGQDILDDDGAMAAGPPPDPDPLGVLAPDDLDSMLRVRLDLLTDGGPPPAIACLALDNFEDLARHHGAAAARLAAASMQQAVAGARLRDEVVGRTVAGSLAVVLPFDGKVDRLWQRARALAEAAEVTASWHGHDLRVHVRLGVHVCAKGEVPAEVLDQAAATARRVV